MTLSLYDATVPTFLQQLNALAGILRKAETWCAEGHGSEEALQEATFADMKPFPWQVRWAATHSLQAIQACRAGLSTPDASPPPTAFAEQHALLGATIAGLEAVTPAELDALADQTVLFRIPARGMELPFTAAGYLLSFAVPNFFFHLTTAYDLLRAAGVPLGKLDYLGRLRLKDPA
ncbi:DUF1993 family protein [Novosphingobium piscinae]|uniref:DUF1993 domain-containing protein n=1 Tax=Novosphingobium piscinae TaxID=1507448 RepID=A0A7X1KPH7_9SPHN|nr:DUF1993 domain-containing protein [Novosphingobium piscinae]MBC2668727.1 DUF1993 domain-containing protein [Novosphingobium piscinae]